MNEPTPEEETEEILNDQGTMDALRTAKEQRDAGQLLPDSTVRPHVAQRVEDSHAKLAAEMRAEAERAFSWTRGDGGRQIDVHPNYVEELASVIEEQAARVEALGRVEEKKAAKARDYLDEAPHLDGCASGDFLAGRPTADGGYEMYLRVPGGLRWYRTTPVDERPACDCGLTEARALVVESASKKEDAGT